MAMNNDKENGLPILDEVGSMDHIPTMESTDEDILTDEEYEDSLDEWMEEFADRQYNDYLMNESLKHIE